MPVSSVPSSLPTTTEKKHGDVRLVVRMASCKKRSNLMIRGREEAMPPMRSMHSPPPLYQNCPGGCTDAQRFHVDDAAHQAAATTKHSASCIKAYVAYKYPNMNPDSVVRGHTPCRLRFVGGCSRIFDSYAPSAACETSGYRKPARHGIRLKLALRCVVVDERKAWCSSRHQTVSGIQR
ncbi:hypothetical protein C8F01DRAFT_1125798 [Mycena amicta]|nr:hypothetical protein C8F01DRAFT_1125798 [Mycena amicta]